MPQKSMFFPVGVGEFGTGRHCGDARLLFSNPGRFGGHKLGNERLGRAARRRHRHPPVRCVNPEVDVLDALPDEFNFNAVNDHGVKITFDQGRETKERKRYLWSCSILNKVQFSKTSGVLIVSGPIKSALVLLPRFGNDFLDVIHMHSAESEA